MRWLRPTGEICASNGSKIGEAMEGPLSPGMQGWLDADVNAFQRSWREYLDGLADHEREILAEPEAWAPVILNDLRKRIERQRTHVLSAWGIDPAGEDQNSGSWRRPRTVGSFAKLSEALLVYEIHRLNLEEIEANVARLPEEHRAQEVCESWLAWAYSVPVFSAVLVEALADMLGKRSAQQARSEVLAANLAGYFACRISLKRAKTLEFLLSLEGGSPFQNLLRHLPLEALGVWDDADPLRQRMDDLAKQAANAVRNHLKRERVKSGGAEPEDRLDVHADDDLITFEARETARAEMDRYTAAKARAGLSTQQREVLDLREAGNSYQEIADALGIKTTGQVGKVLSDGRKKVKAEMDRQR